MAISNRSAQSDLLVVHAQVGGAKMFLTDFSPLRVSKTFNLSGCPPNDY